MRLKLNNVKKEFNWQEKDKTVCLLPETHASVTQIWLGLLPKQQQKRRGGGGGGGGIGAEQNKQQMVIKYLKCRL